MSQLETDSAISLDPEGGSPERPSPAEVTAARIERSQVDKFGERRGQLAAAALATLGELGYARTSLREIAQKSGFSHGVLHYYFRDKVDLITYCVREYKRVCVSRYDLLVETATSAEQLRTAFASELAASVRDDSAMHRLWYDLRNQGFFEQDFRADVVEIDGILEDMIWRIVTTYASLAGSEMALTKGATYSLLDGMFQQALRKNAFGDGDAVANLHDGVWQVLPRLLLSFGAAE